MGWDLAEECLAGESDETPTGCLTTSASARAYTKHTNGPLQKYTKVTKKLQFRTERSFNHETHGIHERTSTEGREGNEEFQFLIQQGTDFGA